MKSKKEKEKKRKEKEAHGTAFQATVPHSTS
jgi:hypothetical protein